MQTKRKILFHKWISFLMIARCGGLLTWAMMYQLSSRQPFHYPTFLDALGQYSFLVAALWIGIIIRFAEPISKMPIGFIAQMEPAYLFEIFPVFALILVGFYITGVEMPFL